MKNFQMQQQQMQQKNEGNIRGQCILKLVSFAEHLNAFVGPVDDNDEYWPSFVRQFFSPNGTFRYGLMDTSSQEATEKTYEIVASALARYFQLHFRGGVTRIQLAFGSRMSDKSLGDGSHHLENTDSCITYSFGDNTRVITNGKLQAIFDSSQKLSLFEFTTTAQEEYLSRSMVLHSAMPNHNWVKDWTKLNFGDAKQSPEMSKKGKQKQFKSPPTAPPEIDLPHSSINQNMGVPSSVFEYLEMVEVMNLLNPLMAYSLSNPQYSPKTALNEYVNQNIVNGGAQNMMNGQPGGVMGNPRTPSFSQFNMGASPAAAHHQLPGSPHMGGSPALSHMQAPGMALQRSQQGTSSSGPSANTSPASNKRRRPSGVKNEDDSGAATPASMGGAPQVNGMGKTKPPTPRIPQKRVKANS